MNRALLCLALVSVLLPTPASAGDPVCNTSNPGPSDNYTTTVCITVPGPGDLIAGDQTVTATASTTHATRTVTEIVFRLDDEYLLTDYQPPYTFELPSGRWADGLKNLKARAIMSSGGHESADTVVEVEFNNGLETPPVNDAQFTPRGEDPLEGEPTVIGVVGDGASGKERGDEVIELIDSWDPHMFLQLGDVYERGSIAEMHNWYGANDRWGIFRSITNPTPGNHEYDTPGAAPYFHYWDNVPHHYSFEEQGWQMISIDSNPGDDYGQQDPTSEQYLWFKDQLSDANPCKIVFMHHPRFRPRAAQGTHLAAMWHLMATSGVDVVLVGHEHNYQRWHPLDELGEETTVGPVQMVVGTGGHEIVPFALQDERMAFGVDSAPDGFGALRVELSEDLFAYEYITTGLETVDQGSITCNDPDTEPPSAPLLIGQADDTPKVYLDWSESTDNRGVVEYHVYKEGQKIAETTERSYQDTDVISGQTYDYYVVSLDEAGNTSTASNEVNVFVPNPPPPPPDEPLFEDDFETGDLQKWDFIDGLRVQDEKVFEGTYSARARKRARPGYASVKLGDNYTELSFETRFKLIGKSEHPVSLARLKPNAADLGRLFLTAKNKLALNNALTGKTAMTKSAVERGKWYHLVVNLTVAGDSSTVQATLNGVALPKLSTTGSLGDVGISRVQLGESTPAKGGRFDIAFDQVVIDN